MKRVLCNVTTRCWNFTGGRYTGGYGAIGVGTSKTAPAHRESYKLFVGAIPDGTELHHICENKLCCNPAHLIPVTKREHQEVSPRWAGHKTHCPKGHPLDEANVVPSALKNRGVRQCLTCQRAAIRANYHANKKKKREYAAANRERINSTARARYAADPDKVIAYQKERRHKRRG